jgi:hypothetical protein
LTLKLALTNTNQLVAQFTKEESHTYRVWEVQDTLYDTIEAVESALKHTGFELRWPTIKKEKWVLPHKGKVEVKVFTVGTRK